MILVDYSQVVISAFLSQMQGAKVEVSEDMLRHMVLNMLRSYNQKFRQKYGKMVLACDAGSWRKDAFAYYKARRKENRETSSIDWDSLFASLDVIREEIKEHFPYPVVHVFKAEADDVIGTLVHELLGNDLATPGQEIMIVSADGDFKQLQCFGNVSQYDPIRKKFLITNNPSAFLKEHIIRGDVGDGVPNCMSPDDSIVLRKRQKPIMEKNLLRWLNLEPKQFCNSDQLRYYNRNELLIDLKKTPSEIKGQIVEDFVRQEGKSRRKLLDFFISRRLKYLMESINEF